MPNEIAPDVPREQQTLRLPEQKLRSLQGWAIDGSGITAAGRVQDSGGRIALVKNSWSDGWILPGGGIEPDENPTEAARREIREETGLNATVHTPLVVLDQSYVEADNGTEWFSALYVVYSASAEGEIPDASQLGVSEGEITAAQWFETLPEDLHDDAFLRSYL